MEVKASAVIALHLQGKRPCDILSELSLFKLNRQFVYRTIKRYSETGSTKKRYGGGRKATVTITKYVKRLRECLRRNPRRSLRKIARTTQISVTSVSRILKKKLNAKPFKIQKVQDLNKKQKQNRYQKARGLKQRHDFGELPNIVFSDEKLFTVEQCLNKQNDRIWASDKGAIDPGHFRATRRQGKGSVMVWAAVTENGRSPLVFIPQGVKINAKIYQDLILEGCLMPWADAHFGKKQWTFQQDSAPSHKAKTTIAWLKEKVPRFISPSEWPSYSPDINPMDFAIWSILESKCCSTRQVSVETLKRRLHKEWMKIPQNQIRDSCISFRHRLERVIKARGGYIEC